LTMTDFKGTRDLLFEILRLGQVRNFLRHDYSREYFHNLQLQILTRQQINPINAYRYLTNSSLEDAISQYYRAFFRIEDTREIMLSHFEGISIQEIENRIRDLIYEQQALPNRLAWKLTGMLMFQNSASSEELVARLEKLGLYIGFDFQFGRTSFYLSDQISTNEDCNVLEDDVQSYYRNSAYIFGFYNRMNDSITIRMSSILRAQYTLKYLSKQPEVDYSCYPVLREVLKYYGTFRRTSGAKDFVRLYKKLILFHEIGHRKVYNYLENDTDLYRYPYKRKEHEDLVYDYVNHEFLANFNIVEELNNLSQEERDQYLVILFIYSSLALLSVKEIKRESGLALYHPFFMAYALGNLSSSQMYDILNTSLQIFPVPDQSWLGSLAFSMLKRLHLLISPGKNEDLSLILDENLTEAREEIEKNPVRKIERNHSSFKGGSSNTEIIDKEIEEYSNGAGDLTQIPDEVFRYSGLKVLDLNYNKINDPEGFAGFPHLEKLCLCRNGLDRIPGEVFELSNLRELYLSGNEITEIPDSIRNLTKLRVLEFNRNKIQEIPDSIGELTELETLDLSQNEISYLPLPVFNLSKLTQLDVSSNQIESLPEVISDLRTLSSLNIARNRLCEISDSISQLKGLEKIDIGDNPISDTETSVRFIFRCAKLKKVSLHGLGLNRIPETLKDLEELESINLSRNPGLNLVQVFSFLAGLKEFYSLDVSENDLDILPEEIGELKGLLSLRANKNGISSIPESLFRLKELTLIMFKDNPLPEKTQDRISKLSDRNRRRLLFS